MSSKEWEVCNLMLKIKDKAGKTVMVLQDDANEPKVLDEEEKKKKEEAEEETNEEEEGE